VSIVLTTDTVFIAIGDTKNIKVLYCTHCHKSYYTKEKCWTLYLHLKQQAKAGKRHRGLSSKKRKTYKDNNELNNLVGLIVHFGMIANNNTGNLLYI
jgi:hypothetical protein